MKKTIVSKLLEKGWSEEEINDYFTKLYRGDKRPKSKKLSRIVFVANFLAIFFLDVVMGALALVFTALGWSVLSLGVIVFFSAWITYRNEIIFSEIFSNRNGFLISLAVSFFLIVIVLLASFFVYDSFMMKIDGGPNSFPLLEYCIVSFAVVIGVGLFLKMFKEK